MLSRVGRPDGFTSNLPVAEQDGRGEYVVRIRTLELEVRRQQNLKGVDDGCSADGLAELKKGVESFYREYGGKWGLRSKEDREEWSEDFGGLVELD